MLRLDAYELDLSDTVEGATSPPFVRYSAYGILNSYTSCLEPLKRESKHYQTTEERHHPASCSPIMLFPVGDMLDEASKLIRLGEL